MTTEVTKGEPFYECVASAELAAAFEYRAIKIVCSENQILFRRGDPGSSVYLVLGGEVRLALPLDGTDGMGFRAAAGAFIGLPAAFSNEPYSMSAFAREGAALALMSREKFCDLIASSPALSMDVLKILAAETRAARIAIVESGIKHRTRKRNGPEENNHII
jgi:CRP-like cAMP-binding protein